MPIARPIATSRVVSAALALDEVALDYEVEMQPWEAAEFLGLAESHANEAESADLVKLVRKADRLIPPMQFGEGNPNNDRPHHRYRIGRQGSRLVKLRIVPTYITAAGGPSFEGLSRRLARLAADCAADEFGAEQGRGDWTFRFWWD